MGWLRFGLELEHELAVETAAREIRLCSDIPALRGVAEQCLRAWVQQSDITRQLIQQLAAAEQKLAKHEPIDPHFRGPAPAGAEQRRAVQCIVQAGEQPCLFKRPDANRRRDRAAIAIRSNDPLPAAAECKRHGCTLPLCRNWHARQTPAAQSRWVIRVSVVVRTEDNPAAKDTHRANMRKNFRMVGKGRGASPPS